MDSTPGWDDPGGASDAGAATLGDGENGTVGLISGANSTLGTSSNDISSVVYDKLRRRLVVGRAASNAEPGAKLLGVAVFAALGRTALRRSAPV